MVSFAQKREEERIRLKLQEMKSRTYTFVAGMIVGLIMAQLVRTVFVGLVVVLLLGAAFWFALNYGRWADKLKDMFRRN